MASQIIESIYDLLKANTGYKLNTWLETAAKSDIHGIYCRVLNESPVTRIYANNTYFALYAFSKCNDILILKEYLAFLDYVVNMQFNSESDWSKHESPV
jgi:hypothetical protein